MKARLELTVIGWLLGVLGKADPVAAKRGLEAIEGYLGRDEALLEEGLIRFRGGNWAARYLAGANAHRLYGRDRGLALDTLRAAALDGDRRVREGAAWGYSHLLAERFDEVYPLFQALVRDPEERVRRAAVVALVPVIRGEDGARAEAALLLLEPLLTDGSFGVRKYIGPKVFSTMAERHPDLYMKHAASWAEREEELVRWHVAEGLAGTPPNHLDVALELLRGLARDERVGVRRGVMRALRELKYKAPERVDEEMERWAREGLGEVAELVKAFRPSACRLRSRSRPPRRPWP
ncbi:MAG: hypothetical protein AABX40_08395 [Candidatus Hydrothermarchaeota archaeon]